MSKGLNPESQRVALIANQILQAYPTKSEKLVLLETVVAVTILTMANRDQKIAADLLDIMSYQAGLRMMRLKDPNNG